MKVLFVRITNRISGAEKYNYYLAQELIRYSDIKPVFLTDCEDFANHLSSQGYFSYKLPIIIKEVGTKKDLLSFFRFFPQYLFIFIFEIHKLRKVHKFNIICFESMTEKIFLTPLLRLFSYKIVWIEHGPLFATESAWLIKKLYYLVSKFSNKIITVSRATENDLLSGGISQLKISTIYIGIDIKDFQNDIESKDRIVPTKKKVIGFIGTLNQQKGIERFMDITEMLLKKDPNLFFLIVGDGPQYYQIISLLKQRRIESKFLLTGYVEDVSLYLRQMNIVIFPTQHHEGLSLAILESLAAGNLIFAYDIGGNSEVIIDNITGYIFKDINNKLVDLILSKLYDRDNQKRIQLNSFRQINKYFNQQRQAQKFKTLLSSI